MHDGCQLVMEDDGTEIDDDLNIMELAGSTFILLERNQRWSKDSAASNTMSEQVPTTEPLSEHSQATSSNASKIQEFTTTSRS